MSPVVEKLDYLVAPPSVKVRSDDDLVRDLSVSQLKLNGRKIVGSILNAVQDVRIRHTIDGASTMTITAKDPDKQLLESGLLTEASTTVVDGLDFTLVKVGYSRSGMVTLEFESSIVARLRRYRKPKKAVRGKVTRAQFARLLVREAKSIQFICPELNVKQPIGSKKGPGDPGFSRNEKFKIKGKRADAAQRRNLEGVLDAGFKRRMPYKVMLAAVITVIQESVARNLKGGDRDSQGLFQQRPSQGWGTPAQVRNIQHASTKFFDAAIKIYRKKPNTAPGDLAQQVQRSAHPHAYKQWLAEGKAILKAYYNADGKSSVANERKKTKRYEFTRGEPGGEKGEDTWACLQRLAEEVEWRCFVQRRAVVFISENRLFATKPVLTLSPDHPALDDQSLDFDIGKRMAELPISVRIAQWDALQGDVIRITGFGPANGRWIVREIEGSLFSLQRTVSLVRMTPKLPEPAAEAVEQAGGGGKGGGTPKFEGKFVWPTAKKTLSSGYGPRNGRNHDGIDVAIPVGTTVSAAAAGKVVFVGVQGGYGNCITIKHDDKFSTHYAHLSSFKVKNGQRVSSGQDIALSGNTGRSTGPHLHFEIRAPRPVDPMRYL